MLFQGILEALKGLGGGVAKGIGASQGLPFLKNIGESTLGGSVMTKNPITGKIAEAATPISKWGKVGEMIGSNLGGSKTLPPAAPSLAGTANTVQKGQKYSLPERQTQIQLMLEKLARLQK